MTTLKEILTEENKILDLVISNGGEITDEQSKELEAVITALCQKADAYSVVMDNLEKRVEAFKMQADLFNTAAKAVKGAQERLKERMKFLMTESGKIEIKGDFVRFSLSNSNPALVINEQELDPAYLMQVVETVPDKKRIAEDLKLGVKIKGARFEETKALRKGVVK